MRTLLALACLLALSGCQDAPADPSGTPTLGASETGGLPPVDNPTIAPVMLLNGSYAFPRDQETAPTTADFVVPDGVTRLEVNFTTVFECPLSHHYGPIIAVVPPQGEGEEFSAATTDDGVEPRPVACPFLSETREPTASHQVQATAAGNWRLELREACTCRAEVTIVAYFS